MKIKFNIPTKRFENSINFDNNTTFGFGNLQPLFAKFVLPKSKFSINISQLTRLSPLVVPTFARLKQINDFVFVPINKVFPAFDAFLSNTAVKGTSDTYRPDSLPCITNQYLFVQLMNYASFESAVLKNGSWTGFSHSYYFTDYRGVHNLSSVHTSVFDNSSFQKLAVASDFQVIDSNSNNPLGQTCCGRFTQEGRYWLTVLRGLGYSCDYYDNKPVSALPLLSFIKAFYDIYYPKRFNSWHTSNIYNIINRHYNGDFNKINYGGHYFDMIKGDLLSSLFGDGFSFYLYSSLDNDVFQAALSYPLLDNTAPQPFKDLTGDYQNNNIFVGGSGSNIPRVETNGSQLTADNLSLVNRLWSFVSRSSVVGQSVKDWFKVHFNINPQEDMFDTSVCFSQKPNFISINAVVSTADTSNSNGSQLGDLAGQAFSNVNDSVSYDVPDFGYIFCISGLLPLTRVSGGTQPELYNVGYYDMPFPDFDGLGYEVLNNSSFMETYSGYFDTKNGGSYAKSGYGYVPRLTSFKTYNNIRSGGFALPSVKDSYLSYCEDSIVDPHNPDLPSPSNLKAFFPWRYVGFTSSFMSYDRIFYNQSTLDPFFSQQYIVDDNFMCQTAFDIKISSFLKPLSDSYSIESLGNELVSVTRQ